MSVLPARAGFSQSPATPSRSASGAYASVELLAAPDAGDGDFWLGLRFHLEPGWHIYWQNPGDSGSPPTVTWNLPDGYSVGEIEWPAPDRIAVGSLVNYGYEREVTFPARVRVRSATLGTRALVAATVKWVVCRDVCVPGRGNLQIALPLSAADRAAAPSWGAAIEAARARVPRPAPASWHAHADSDRDAFVLTVDTGRPERDALFFPVAVSQVDDSALQQFESLGRGFRLRLRKSDQLVGVPASLTGVVRLASGQAYLVSAPVMAANERKPR